MEWKTGIRGPTSGPTFYPLARLVSTVDSCYNDLPRTYLMTNEEHIPE